MARIGAVREAGGDQRAFQAARLADAHAAILQVRTAAASGAEDLPAHRVVHHRVFQPALDLAGDRDGKDREAVQEVGRAIQRIDDPYRVAVTARATFLGKEGMARVVALDDADDLCFGGLVDLGDEVVAALGRDLQGFHAVQAADDDFAGAAGGAHGNVEKRLHGN